MDFENSQEVMAKIQLNYFGNISVNKKEAISYLTSNETRIFGEK